MRFTQAVALTAAALMVLGAGDALAKGKKKKKVELHPSVTYAKTWDAAVEEGKLLNLPIVVHNHGFN